jgi:hypothetical protein
VLKHEPSSWQAPAANMARSVAACSYADYAGTLPKGRPTQGRAHNKVPFTYDTCSNNTNAKTTASNRDGARPLSCAPV